MREVRLTPDEILTGYDALAEIYSHVPPLIMWRAGELAAYRHHHLDGPVLDLGCGDGRFFREAWGTGHDVVGLDADESVATLARRTGLYREVRVAPAHALPFADATFATVFANCALEHMDRLGDVMAEVSRVLQPGGTFLLSVITDRYVKWGPLRLLLSACGEEEAGSRVQRIHDTYHHHVNPLSLAGWVDALADAGMVATTWTPLMQGVVGWTFLLFDQLWHMPHEPGEFGDRIAAALLAAPNRAAGSRQVLEGLLTLSSPTDEYAGAVLHARKVRTVDLAEQIAAIRLQVVTDEARRAAEHEVRLGASSAPPELVSALREQLAFVEADREARLHVIQQQAGALGEAQARASLLEAEATALRQQLEVAEADRAARLHVIEEQGRALGAATARSSVLDAEIVALRQHLEGSEADRAARLAVIEAQGRALADAAQREALLSQEITQLRQAIDASRAERDARIAEAARTLEEAHAVTAALRHRVATLEAYAHAVGNGRLARTLRLFGRGPGAPPGRTT